MLRDRGRQSTRRWRYDPSNQGQSAKHHTVPIKDRNHSSGTGVYKSTNTTTSRLGGNMTRFLAFVLLTVTIALWTEVQPTPPPVDQSQPVTFHKDVLPVLQNN